jgi:hypothetical protein
MEAIFSIKSAKATRVPTIVGLCRLTASRETTAPADSLGLSPKARGKETYDAIHAEGSTADRQAPDHGQLGCDQLGPDHTQKREDQPETQP